MAIEGLDDVFTGEAAPAPEPIEQPVQEPAPAPEPAPEPAPPPAPEPEPKPQDHTVPLAKFLDTRDELKEERRRRQELEAAQQQPKQRPDPFDNPDEYHAFLEGEMNQRMFAQKIQMSDQMARMAHGDEKTEAAVNWAAEQVKSDPTFGARYASQPHPIDWIVRQHKQSLLLSDIGDNPDDWFTREAAKRGYVAATAIPAVAEVQPTPTAQPALNVPPRSIASETPAPAHTVDPLAEFNAIFSK